MPWTRFTIRSRARYSTLAPHPTNPKKGAPVSRREFQRRVIFVKDGAGIMHFFVEPQPEELVADVVADLDFFERRGHGPLKGLPRRASPGERRSISSTRISAVVSKSSSVCTQQMKNRRRAAVSATAG